MHNVIFVKTAAAPFNVGQTTQGSSSGTYTGITAVRITTPKSGTLQSISIFLNTAGINMLLGIYSDVSSAPNTLLASSALTSSAIGTNTLAISSGPLLSAGNYWLAIQSQSGVSGFYVSGGSGAWNNGASWTGALPTTWPASSSGAFLFSLYATFLG